METRPVCDIVIGERARKELGFLAPLEASVKEVGLLHPIVINSRAQLISGRRRLEVCKRLGWTDVPVTVIDTLDDAVLALKAEQDENFLREPMAPLEFAELGRRIEAEEKPKASTRRREGARHGGEASGKLPEASRGQTRDKVASALGVSGKTYEKVKAVVEAAEQHPEQFGDLAEKLAVPNAKVDPVFKELRQRQESRPSPTSVDECAVGTCQAHCAAPAADSVVQDPAPGKFSPGVLMATEAIQCLARVKRSEPSRAYGLALVLEWIKENQ
jgi:hypothetical protein